MSRPGGPLWAMGAVAALALSEVQAGALRRLGVPAGPRALRWSGGEWALAGGCLLLQTPTGWRWLGLDARRTQRGPGIVLLLVDESEVGPHGLLLRADRERPAAALVPRYEAYRRDEVEAAQARQRAGAEARMKAAQARVESVLGPPSPEGLPSGLIEWRADPPRLDGRRLRLVDRPLVPELHALPGEGASWEDCWPVYDHGPLRDDPQTLGDLQRAAAWLQEPPPPPTEAFLRGFRPEARGLLRYLTGAEESLAREAWEGRDNPLWLDEALSDEKGGVEGWNQLAARVAGRDETEEAYGALHAACIRLGALCRWEVTLHAAREAIRCYPADDVRPG